jgi:hypothetical protein
VGEAETLYRQIYEHRAPMIRFITTLRMPLPKAFYAAAELVLNSYLRHALEQEEIDAERVNTLLETAKLEGVAIDADTLEFAYRHNVQRMAERLLANPTVDLLGQLDRAAALLDVLPFRVDLWKIQNACYRLLENVYASMVGEAERGDAAAQAWVSSFRSLATKLSIKVP